MEWICQQNKELTVVLIKGRVAQQEAVCALKTVLDSNADHASLLSIA